MTMAKSPGQWTRALDRSGLPDKAPIGGKAWAIAPMSALGRNAKTIITQPVLRALLLAAQPPIEA